MLQPSLRANLEASLASPAAMATMSNRHAARRQNKGKKHRRIVMVSLPGGTRGSGPETPSSFSAQANVKAFWPAISEGSCQPTTTECRRNPYRSSRSAAQLGGSKKSAPSCLHLHKNPALIHPISNQPNHQQNREGLRHRGEQSNEFEAPRENAHGVVNPTAQKPAETINKKRVHSHHYQREHRLADARVFHKQDDGQQS